MGRGKLLYAVTGHQLDKKRKAKGYKDSQQILMHRLLTGCPAGFVVDHINGNGLDNRRSNLRICDHASNVQRGFRTKASSGFRGVYPNHVGFDAKIAGNYLGWFRDPCDAARAYDAAARARFGEMAVTNFD